MIGDFCKTVAVAATAAAVGIVALVVAVHILLAGATAVLNGAVDGYAAYWQSVSQQLQNAQSGEVQP